MFESKCQIMWGVYTSRAKLWMVHKFSKSDWLFKPFHSFPHHLVLLKTVSLGSAWRDFSLTQRWLNESQLCVWACVAVWSCAAPHGPPGLCGDVEHLRTAVSLHTCQRSRTSWFKKSWRLKCSHFVYIINFPCFSPSVWLLDNLKIHT